MARTTTPTTCRCGGAVQEMPDGPDICLASGRPPPECADLEEKGERLYRIVNGVRLPRTVPAVACP